MTLEQRIADEIVKAQAQLEALLKQMEEKV